jgi:hypothetical protein
MTYHLGKPYITTFGIGSVWECGRKFTHNCDNKCEKVWKKQTTQAAGIIDSQSVKTAEKRGKCTVTMAANE